MLGRRELAEAESAMLLMVMMLVMILRGRRGFSHATHQAEGTANTSATASEGGARRHRPVALKHPEEPNCDVGLTHALIPCREERALRPFPALPAVHLSRLEFTDASNAARKYFASPRLPFNKRERN